MTLIISEKEREVGERKARENRLGGGDVLEKKRI